MIRCFHRWEADDTLVPAFILNVRVESGPFRFVVLIREIDIIVLPIEVHDNLTEYEFDRSLIHLLKLFFYNPKRRKIKLEQKGHAFILT